MRTTRSVRQSRKLLFSLWLMLNCANMREPQLRIFLRRTQSYLLRYCSFSFSETKSSCLSRSRPWQQPLVYISVRPQVDRISFLVIRQLLRLYSRLFSSASRALTRFSASSQSLSCSSIRLRILSGSMMLELDLMWLQARLTFAYFLRRLLLLVRIIWERMRCEQSTQRILQSYSFSIRDGAISLIYPSLLCFSALRSPSSSRSLMSASSKEMYSVLSLACWSEIFLASFLSPVSSRFNCLSS